MPGDLKEMLKCNALFCFGCYADIIFKEASHISWWSSVLWGHSFSFNFLTSSLEFLFSAAIPS